MKKLLFLFFLITISYANAQVGIGGNPDNSAMLDIQSTDKGLLIPRVNLSNITDTSLDGTNTVSEGMIIYNTNANITGGNGKGLYYFNGTQWQKFTVNSYNVSSVTIGTNEITKSNTAGEDVAGYDTALEPSVYNKDGKIQVKLVVKYESINAGNVNFQIRARNLNNTDVWPITNGDFGTHASTGDNRKVATSAWVNWDATTTAYEIHLFSWVSSGSIKIISAYLLVRSQ